MSKSGNLWAIGFEGTERAAAVRDEITRLAGENHCLILLDIAVAVRYADGSFALNDESFPIVTYSRGSTVAHFLASLALGAPPLTGGAVGALLGKVGEGVGEGAGAVGISDDFVRDVAGLIKPGTSGLFVLDECGDMDALLHAIRGLGGTVLRTNVDLERAKLIQSTLADSAGTT
jgi:uncharacterized membrane protein